MASLVVVTPRQSAGVPQSSRLDAATVTQLTSASVVTIRTFDHAGAPLAGATGFFIDPHTIATNYHVVGDASRAIAIDIDNRTLTILGCTAYDRTRDFALLRVADDHAGKALALESTPPALGTEVCVIGSPKGLDRSVSVGVLSGVREISVALSQLQITAPVSPGSSGSPVLDHLGRAIGIVTSQLTDGQNLNFACPASALLSKPQGVLQPLHALRGLDDNGGSIVPPQPSDFVEGLLRRADFAKAIALLESIVPPSPIVEQRDDKRPIRSSAESLEAIDEMIRNMKRDLVKGDASEAQWCDLLLLLADAWDGQDELLRQRGELPPLFDDFDIQAPEKIVERERRPAAAYRGRALAGFRHIQTDSNRVFEAEVGAGLALHGAPAAVEHLRKAVSLHPDSAIASAALGSSLISIVDRSSTIEGLRILESLVAAGKIDRRIFGQIRYAYAWIGAMESVDKINASDHFKRALSDEELARAMIARFSDSVEAWELLGNSVKSCKQGNEAFQVAIRLNPARAYTHYHYSELLSACDEDKRAEEELRKCIALAPFDEGLSREFVIWLVVHQRATEAAEHCDRIGERFPKLANRLRESLPTHVGTGK